MLERTGEITPPYEQRRIMPSAGLFCLVRGCLVLIANLREEDRDAAV